MENWAEKQITTIENKLEQVDKRDKRFYRIDELKRNIRRLEQFATNCSTCRQHQKTVEDIVDIIDVAVEEPGKTRRRLDGAISKLALHMQKEHRFYAPYYFTYLYSFWGIVVGILIGVLLLLINPNDKMLMVSIGFSVGLIVGYYLGNKKDKVIRRENRLM